MTAKTADGAEAAMDRPSDPTPGGGGGWEHDQFNRELDLIGKTIRLRRR